jgi:hypothetical protein
MSAWFGRNYLKIRDNHQITDCRLCSRGIKYSVLSVEFFMTFCTLSAIQIRYRGDAESGLSPAYRGQRMRHQFPFSALLLFTLSLPALAWAALGDNAASVQADQAKLKATLRPAITTPNYSVHEIQTPEGVVVKEFVATSGTVFAVVWHGPTMPNLQQLLGQYFNDYVAAAKAPHDGHKHLAISQPGLVVESQGHLRAFFGKAYLPTQLPAGVTPAELQ